MKIFKYILVLSVIMWIILCVMMLSSCSDSKEIKKPPDKIKMYYKITPVSKDSIKERSVIVVG